jgi:hypothetical protein
MSPSSSTPQSVPATDPSPPVSRVPPTTTAAIAVSSQPTPSAGWPAPYWAASSTPAIPARPPLMAYTSSLTRSTRRPISRAVSSWSPMASTCRLNGVRPSTRTPTR